MVFFPPFAPQYAVVVIVAAAAAVLFHLFAFVCLCECSVRAFFYTLFIKFYFLLHT